MSLTDSILPHGNYMPVPEAVMLSLNEVFRESMKKAQNGSKETKMIVRCEMLPEIKGHRKQFEQLFELLLRLIMNCPASGTKRYLYVDCEEETEVADRKIKEGSKKYLIKFYTNTTISDEWLKDHQPQLEKCAAILSAHQGHFIFNNIRNTGCLFSITVPGNFE